MSRSPRARRIQGAQPERKPMAMARRVSLFDRRVEIRLAPDLPPVHGDAQLMQDLAPYLGEKGNLKFPLAEPIPYPLIKRVVNAHVAAHLDRLAAKSAKKKAAKPAGNKSAKAAKKVAKTTVA